MLFSFVFILDLRLKPCPKNGRKYLSLMPDSQKEKYFFPLWCSASSKAEPKLVTFPMVCILDVGIVPTLFLFNKGTVRLSLCLDSYFIDTD